MRGLLRLIGCLMVLLVMLCAGVTMGQGQKAVAVPNFEVNTPNEQLKYLGKGLADMLIANLASSNKVKVVERSRLGEALEELGLAVSGIVDESSAAKLGRILGANVVLLGTLTDLGNMLSIDIRVVDVETSEIIGAATERVTATVDLADALTRLCSMVVSTITGEELQGLGPDDSGPPTASAPAAPTKVVDVKEVPQGQTAMNHRPSVAVSLFHDERRQTDNTVYSVALIRTVFKRLVGWDPVKVLRSVIAARLREEGLTVMETIRWELEPSVISGYVSTDFVIGGRLTRCYSEVKRWELTSTVAFEVIVADVKAKNAVYASDFEGSSVVPVSPWLGSLGVSTSAIEDAQRQAFEQAISTALQDEQLRAVLGIGNSAP